MLSDGDTPCKQRKLEITSSSEDDSLALSSSAERETSAVDAMLRLSGSVPSTITISTAPVHGSTTPPFDDNGEQRIARRQREFIPDFHKDDYYWLKRRKNNEAAKRSREKRRSHDMAMVQRIVALTNENEQLQRQLGGVKQSRVGHESQTSVPSTIIEQHEGSELSTPVFPELVVLTSDTTCTNIHTSPSSTRPKYIDTTQGLGPLDTAADSDSSDCSVSSPSALQSSSVPSSGTLPEFYNTSTTASYKPCSATASSSSDDGIKTDWTLQQRAVPIKMRHKLFASSDHNFTNNNRVDSVTSEAGSTRVVTDCPDADSTSAMTGGQDTCHVDVRYVERRQRNNMAARKCRENRKVLNEVRLTKANILENENDKLKRELRHLASEFSVLKRLLEQKQRAESMGEQFVLPPLEQALRNARSPSPEVSGHEDNT